MSISFTDFYNIYQPATTTNIDDVDWEGWVKRTGKYFDNGGGGAGA